MVYWCKDLPSVEAKYFMGYFCIYNLCKTKLNDIDILQTAKDISCPVKVMSAINSMADFISSWSGPFLYRPLMPGGCYPPILFYLPCTDNFYILSTTSPSSLILGMINLSLLILD